MKRVLPQRGSPDSQASWLYGATASGVVPHFPPLPGVVDPGLFMGVPSGDSVSISEISFGKYSNGPQDAPSPGPPAPSQSGRGLPQSKAPRPPSHAGYPGGYPSIQKSAPGHPGRQSPVQESAPEHPGTQSWIQESSPGHPKPQSWIQESDFGHPKLQSWIQESDFGHFGTPFLRKSSEQAQ